MRKARRKYLRIYRKRWRAECYFKAVCTECDNPVFQDKTRCRKHLIMRSKSQQQYRDRKKNEVIKDLREMSKH